MFRPLLLLLISSNSHHLVREPASLETMDHGSDPDDRFGGSGASVTPISVGSRLLKSPLHQPPLVRYRECLKNHAASNGRNVTDGCGEFMPSGDDGTLEALKCAACNCHRNFHRKLVTNATIPVGPFLALPPPPSPSPSSFFNHHPNWASSINTPRSGSTYSPHPMKIATGESGGNINATGESSSEELHFIAGGGMLPYGMTKKRFRSKFTQEQKEKMLEFAEKVGWRIPREDDPQVQSFCSEVGVKRQVLKVWMHNNKAVSAGKKQQQQQQQQDSTIDDHETTSTID
uniref:zinc-finger homeodomain protein 5-like isoform X2 n=1 Tax=Erigeron canadensis TaxID=72917 RepID=UPI001CB9CDF1|nr:zinc-finger homeodomain protein 5-like isoform X2 [Erigeron canadensis]